MYYMKAEMTPSSAAGKLIARLVITPIIVMLCLGALGNSLSIDMLRSLGFWDALLLSVLCQALFTTSQIDSWKIANSKEELK